jgi:hypothetical protein
MELRLHHEMREGHACVRAHLSVCSCSSSHRNDWELDHRAKLSHGCKPCITDRNLSDVTDLRCPAAGTKYQIKDHALSLGPFRGFSLRTPIGTEHSLEQLLSNQSQCIGL